MKENTCDWSAAHLTKVCIFLQRLVWTWWHICEIWGEKLQLWCSSWRDSWKRGRSWSRTKSSYLLRGLLSRCRRSSRATGTQKTPAKDRHTGGVLSYYIWITALSREVKLVLPYQHIFFVNTVVLMVLGLVELKMVLCAAGASEWTGYTGRIQSSFAPVRRVGLSTVIWDYPVSSRCGWTLGKSVAGETICEFFHKNNYNDLKKCVSAALNTRLAKTMNRLMAYKYHMLLYIL